MKPRSILDVAEGHLCCGCGACAYLEPEGVTMVNITERGLRPSIAPGYRTRDETLACCPGRGLAHPADHGSEVIDELIPTWGPVRGVYEGFAADDEIRFAGSSAGAATAISLHCLENEAMSGVLHIAAKPDAPWLNHTVFSTTRSEMLAATGSRYAPASPCDRLDLIEQADAPAVFIGKPCDVAAVQAARRVRPELDRRIGLTIAVFCAGTPSTRGTLEMLAAMGIDDPTKVATLRYRGNGWPGPAAATTCDGTTHEFTYQESWGAILQKHRQWRCYVCADHTGEFADIAVGDPWYEQPDGVDPGRSLIVPRTDRGQRVLDAAITSGSLNAWQVDDNILARSQPNLEKTRGAVLARIIVTRLFGAAAPRYTNMPMAHAWLRHLDGREKLSSIGGTAKRVFRKGLRNRVPVPAVDSAPSS